MARAGREIDGRSDAGGCLRARAATRWFANSDGASIRRPSWAGRNGAPVRLVRASRGASTILKSRRRRRWCGCRRRSPWSSDVVAKARAGAARSRRGGAAGSSRSTTCVSDPSWPWTSIKARRPSRVGRETPMNQAGSGSAKTATSSLSARPEPVQHHPAGAVVVVLLDIEEAAPNRAVQTISPVGVHDAVVEVRAGRRGRGRGSRTAPSPRSSALQANLA